MDSFSDFSATPVQVAFIDGNVYFIAKDVFAFRHLPDNASDALKSARYMINELENENKLLKQQLKQQEEKNPDSLKLRENIINELENELLKNQQIYLNPSLSDEVFEVFQGSKFTGLQVYKDVEYWILAFASYISDEEKAPLWKDACPGPLPFARLWNVVAYLKKIQDEAEIPKVQTPIVRP